MRAYQLAVSCEAGRLLKAWLGRGRFLFPLFILQQQVFPDSGALCFFEVVNAGMMRLANCRFLPLQFLCECFAIGGYFRFF